MEAAPFQVSETAKLLAKDPSKDLAVLHDLLNRLKDKELDGLIDEIQQKINALNDSADKIGKVAEKMSELLPDTIGGEAAALGACGWDQQGSSGAETLAMFIMSRIAEMGEDDLHDMLDEMEQHQEAESRSPARWLDAGGAAVLLVGTRAIPWTRYHSPAGC